jgi:hypothetical protein
MTTTKKIALVFFGYILAIALAAAVVYLYVLATDTPERVASGGMYAFGDSMVFLAAFGLASLPATGAALYFLRGNRLVWIVLSTTGLALAVTGIAALFAVFTPHMGPSRTWLHLLADLSPIRVLVAPPFELAFCLAGIFAPTRWPRVILLLVAVSEAAVFGLTLLHWFRSP